MLKPGGKGGDKFSRHAGIYHYAFVGLNVAFVALMNISLISTFQLGKNNLRFLEIGYSLNSHFLYLVNYMPIQ